MGKTSRGVVKMIYMHIETGKLEILTECIIYDIFHWGLEDIFDEYEFIGEL